MWNEVSEVFDREFVDRVEKYKINCSKYYVLLG